MRILEGFYEEFLSFFVFFFIPSDFFDYVSFRLFTVNEVTVALIEAEKELQ